MKKILSKLKPGWPRPFIHSPWEIGIIRLAFGWIFYDVCSKGSTAAGQDKPTGIAHWIDLTFFANEGFQQATQPILLFLFVAYVFGIALPVILPVMLALVIGHETLENSQGSINHNSQIFGMCLLAQMIWHWIASAQAWRWTVWDEVGIRREIYSTFLCQQVLAASYVVSAISKITAKGNWLADSINYPLQLVKTERTNYYDDLVGHTTSDGSFPFGLLQEAANFARQGLIDNPWLCPFVLSIGLFLEVFAFLILYGRRPSLLIGGLLISFHIVVHFLMGLTFQYNILMLVVLCLGLPYWIAKFSDRAKRSPKKV